MRPFTPKAPTALLPPLPLRLLPGGVPGREFHPLKSSAFSRRTVTPAMLPQGASDHFRHLLCLHCGLTASTQHRTLTLFHDLREAHDSTVQLSMR